MVGIVIGLALSAALIYFFEITGQHRVIFATYFGHRTKITAPSDTPRQVLSDFNADFNGNIDLLQHRAGLNAHAATQAWDKAVMTANQQSGNPFTDATEGCGELSPSQSVSVTPEFAEKITNAQTNVLFIANSLARCFKTKTDVAVIVDDFVYGSNFYQILGRALIDRIAQFDVTAELGTLLQLMKLTPQDALYLMNQELAPIRHFGKTSALLISFRLSTESYDSDKIPAFVPGAISLTAENTATLFSSAKSIAKPVLVDARDKRNLSAGPPYKGAITAAVTAADLSQLQFQMPLPLTKITGATFDLSALPPSRDIPLVIYGNDETDAAPLWVIRNLRLQNYRNLYYVSGGIKALKQLDQPLAL